MDAGMWFTAYALSEIAIVFVLYKMRDILLDPQTIPLFLYHRDDEEDNDYHIDV